MSKTISSKSKAFRDAEKAKLFRAKQKLEHTPTLNTVLMVEETLKNMNESVTVAELKRKLPRQVNHNTLKVILGYLEKSNKMAVSLKGISWVHSTSPAIIGTIRENTMLNKEQIIKKIEQNKDKIKSFGVKKLVLIGSYARNEATKDSDIDFLVEFKQGRGLFDDYVHLLHFLEEILGKNIDLGETNLVREELKPYILGGKKIEAKI